MIPAQIKESSNIALFLFACDGVGVGSGDRADACGADRPVAQAKLWRGGCLVHHPLQIDGACAKDEEIDNDEGDQRCGHGGSGAMPRWGLHLRVHRQNPCGRHQRTKGDHGCCKHMQLVADTFAPEEHDAKEPRFQKECGEDFIGHKRAKHWTCLVREDRPVGAELIRHDSARDDAHAEYHGKYFLPVSE